MTEVDIPPPESSSEDDNNDNLPQERPGGLLSKVDGHLVMYHEPAGLQAEQYRACRTNLTALNTGGAPWAVVVTSSKRGEGKSVTAANLAACLAELPGTRVCLLDLDSRKPSLTELLGIDLEVGVTELVRGEATFNEVKVASIIPNMDVIGSGSEPHSPAELLGSEQFVNLMEELKRRYSWIILDAPPVNPWTDACVVSALVNGALLVVRLQDMPRHVVNRSIENIGAAGGRVLGSFLTGLIPDAADDSSHYGYGRAFVANYGDEEDSEGSRLKQREKAEKRLRKQERAFLKRLTKKQKRAADDDAPV